MEKHLYNIFAQRWYRGGSIYFYSDPHFSDEEMNEYRNITDEEQVKIINSRVHKNDTLIILGDIGNIEYIKKLNGYKVLIMGNHDKGASNYKREIIETLNPIEVKRSESKMLMSMPQFEDNHLFDEVYEGALMISNKIILSHEPIRDLPPFLFNIHGHDHAKSFEDEFHLNVCAENIDFTPVSLKEIINTGKLKEVADIHRLAIDRRVAFKNLTGEIK